MRTCRVGMEVLGVGLWRGGFGCWALDVGRWRGGFGWWALGGVSAVVGVVVGLNDGVGGSAINIPSHHQSRELTQLLCTFNTSLTPLL